MVEFDSVQSAQRAKASLNGADIYSGCCTLKIEYAKPTRLNVFKNDQDTWDYTNPNLSGQGNPDGYFVLSTAPCLFTRLVCLIDPGSGLCNAIGLLVDVGGLGLLRLGQGGNKGIAEEEAGKKGRNG